MNCENENQHFVSKVLLKRFKRPNQPLQCYRVDTKQWEPRSTDRACSAAGYNQLLENGNVDGKVEALLSKQESRLPETLRTLDRVAISAEANTTLELRVYENLCRYSALLWLISPAAKAGAAPMIMSQMNRELEGGHTPMLKLWGMPDEQIRVFREAYAQGRRLMMEADNVVQIAHTVQVQWGQELQYRVLGASEWTIANCPINLGLSDVVLVPISWAELKLVEFILPIAPRLLARCRTPGGGTLHLDEKAWPRTMNRIELQKEEAEAILDRICASAVGEIVSPERIADIEGRRARARASGIRYHRIVDPERVKEAGQIKTCGEARFRMAEQEEYCKYVNSFVLPP